MVYSHFFWNTTGVYNKGLVYKRIVITKLS